MEVAGGRGVGGEVEEVMRRMLHSNSKNYLAAHAQE